MSTLYAKVFLLRRSVSEPGKEIVLGSENLKPADIHLVQSGFQPPVPLNIKVYKAKIFCLPYDPDIFLSGYSP